MENAEGRASANGGDGRARGDDGAHEGHDAREAEEHGTHYARDDRHRERAADEAA